MNDVPSNRDARPGAAEPARMRDAFVSSGFGVGLVLVLLPAAAVFAGAAYLAEAKLVGLPILAIFGIVVLLGTLALVAMLFQRLQLTNRDEPLGLPPGSMRAAIALSLIVLFAIISIMLYLSIADPSGAFKVRNLTEPEHKALVSNATARVVDVVEAPCAASVPAGGSCATADRRFDVRLRSTPAPEATDLAKQLLVLVGTLMTSVTSFYFATRGAAEALVRTSDARSQRDADAADGKPKPDAPSDAGKVRDGVAEPTPADELPAARGGVEKER